jgi:hypothetical protein
LASVASAAAADSNSAGQPLPVPERGFVSSEPAETWEQGLISGNGTIGVNVLSRPLDETIIFTHERMFLPQGEPVVPPDTAARLSEVRALIDQGKYQEATQLAFDLSGQDGFMYPDPFVPAFDLRIQTEAEGEVTDYMRSVDFQTGEATVHWADDRGAFERRLFVSRADGVAVLQITGPKQGSVDCRMEMAPRQPSPKLNPKTVEQSAARFDALTTGLETTADKSSLTFRNGFTKAYAGSIQSLEGVAWVDAPGATVLTEGSSLIVTGADRVLVLIGIDPIYEANSSRIEATKKMLSEITVDYPTLLARHARLHGELFNRVRLDIGGGADHQLTSEALLEKTSDEDLCEALVEKTFDAGRYNIICATGELPPTLQGVWGGTYVPSWASDFTQNGNVPSAIAAMLMGNTPEQMLAYTTYIESIVPGMRINAKNIFGARGIVLPSRTTTNGYNNALAPRFAGGMWVGGAPWAAHFFYDYYLYTGDREFLAKHALPFMQEAALFFEDYLYEGPDGKYIFNPTTSPENSPKNTRSQGTFNATMDIAAAKELLHNVIAASTELGVNQEKIPVWEEDAHQDARLHDQRRGRGEGMDDTEAGRQPGASSLVASLRVVRRDAGGDRSRLEAPGRLSKDRRDQARKPLQASRVHVFWRGPAWAGGHQLGRGRVGLPEPDPVDQQLLAAQSGLDAQQQVAVQYGRQRRHARGDHQDACGIGSWQTPVAARVAEGLAVGNDRRRPLPWANRDQASALGRRPHSGHPRLAKRPRDRTWSTRRNIRDSCGRRRRLDQKYGTQKHPQSVSACRRAGDDQHDNRIVHVWCFVQHEVTGSVRWSSRSSVSVQQAEA